MRSAGSGSTFLLGAVIVIPIWLIMRPVERAEGALTALSALRKGFG